MLYGRLWWGVWVCLWDAGWGGGGVGGLLACLALMQYMTASNAVRRGASSQDGAVSFVFCSMAHTADLLPFCQRGGRPGLGPA